MVSMDYSEFLVLTKTVALYESKQFSIDVLPKGDDLTWTATVRYLESEGFVIAAITEKFPEGVYCAEGVTVDGKLKGWKLESEVPTAVVVKNIGWAFCSQKPEAPKTHIQGLKFVPHHVMGLFIGKEGQWSKPFYIPSGKILVSVADTSGIQYGQAGFEGCMVSRDENSTIWGYRLDKNAIRFDKTSQSLDLPGFDPATHEEAMRQVVAWNRDYVPEKSEGKLYIRPSICGLDGGLGIIVPDHYIVTVEIAAFGNYLPESITVEALKYVHRPPTGASKIAPNYGGTYKIKHMVKDHGYNDFLSFDTEGNAEEVSTCAVGFIDAKGTFVFPPVLGDIDDKARNILPSFTRESTIEILRKTGEDVEIRDVPFDEVAEMKGIFTMGNAVGVLHVSKVCMRKTPEDKGVIVDVNGAAEREKIFGIRDMIYKARVGQLEGFEAWAKVI